MFILWKKLRMLFGLLRHASVFLYPIVRLMGTVFDTLIARNRYRRLRYDVPRIEDRSRPLDFAVRCYGD